MCPQQVAEHEVEKAETVPDDPWMSAGALRVWVDAYGPALRRFLARRVGDAEAEEMVQEIFLAVHRRQSPAPIDNPEGYLFRAARHLLARRGQAAVFSEEDVQGHAAEWPSPESELAAKEELARTLEAIRGLPPRAREAFVLHRFEDMSYTMIATRMGISLSAVRQLISRALSQIAEQVGRPR